MARYRRGRMALYEVMSKAKGKPGYLRTLKSMRVEKAPEEGPSIESAEEKDTSAVAEAAVEPSPAVVSDGAVAAELEKPAEKSSLYVKWRRKPRVVQYNHGRVEFSVPYQLGIAVVLGLTVLVLLAFRAGQRWTSVERAGVESARPTGSGSSLQPLVVDRNKSIRRDSPPVEPKPPKTGDAATAPTTGDTGTAATTPGNAIVLVQYRLDRDLVPVRAHFASYGIATEIVKSGSQYFLITQERYNSFAPGGDGQLAKQKIAEVGAEYKGKAPEGYETFAPHYFSDAYPKKVN